MNKYENTLTNISLSDMPKKDKIVRLMDLYADVILDFEGTMTTDEWNCVSNKIKQCAMALVE